MTSAQAQAHALRAVAGLRRREDLIIYRVSGDDHRSWLNGQVTSDVRDAGPGQAVYGLAITVKGRIMADLWVMDLGDDSLHVALPKAAAETVIARFDEQIIMEDVELTPRPELAVLSLQGPKATELARTAPNAAQDTVVVADELGLGGAFVLVEEPDARFAVLGESVAAAGGCTLDDAGWELCRISLGVPRFGRDFGDDTYPQEAGLKARAVSFNKGCYVGQEVVCTLENRGRLSRRLCQLRADTAPPVQATLRTEDKDVGRITSVTPGADGAEACLALGYVKQAAAEPGRTLTTDTGPIEVVALIGAEG